MNLLIIEGAGKVKKISAILKELNQNCRVFATCGHIERLKDCEYDSTGISKSLEYNFEWIEGKSKILMDINEAAKDASRIYIASDPDREGEGIAWHIYNKLNVINRAKAERITFNEISPNAIKKAFTEPRQIDINYVNAYLARIALDKKIGYGLSKYLQQNAKLPSAGRVQSVVLKLIKEREDEINNFVPKTTYSFAPEINGVVLSHQKTYNDLGLFTNHLNKAFSFNELSEAKKYREQFLNENKFKLFYIGEATQKKTYPSKPFKTSTIQSELIKQLKINSKQAEKILQELYQQGYITYPRTDATRISQEFCNEAYNFVKAKYPNLANNEFKFNKSGGGAQDAHEAIRAVHLDELGDALDNELKIAYKIIYDQTIIQFMNPCVSEITEYCFINNKDEFSAKSEIILEQGFNEYLNKNKENKIVDFNLNAIYNADNYNEIIKSSTTTPPSPFNQASLIKELEKLGIGRPSTYASSVAVNNQRNYTKQDKKEVLSTTDEGKKANECLKNEWSELINYTFTAKMEEALDKIADGKLNYKQYLREFLDGFENKLYKSVSLEKKEYIKPEYEVVGKCPECNSDVILKVTTNGKKLKECTKRKYDFKTKKVKGCKYQEWIND